ncbi:putative interactor of constitutive active ROPs [Medicago truncatula]|uniref:Interactor of constitutive active ROPs-like protein n=2 Tax=Medicago truncatula TaxID=3880 RepID=G7L1R0_MEDTR|nr:interactor of constitutive active ROPs 2, chloroplastic [Medicago truncatula]AES81801.1 interactor of constitutive active ROPs-like protein [Medicago truncatula]RHN48431.1 putative interactor of constitutive active ROPs [Medicago truncatula]
MQTPKARSSAPEMSQRKSPAATPRTARQLKTPNSGSNSASSSPNPIRKTPKDMSPRVNERRLSHSPISEKKRPSKVQELESQIAKLQEDLKSAKDQLNSSESWKRKVQEEAEEAKKQILSLSKELEESRQQFSDLSASEETRLQELSKISQDRDRAWQSELEAVQKQHSMDSSALVSAMNEIHKLKSQLERASESESSQANNAKSDHAQIQDLRMDLSEAISVMEKLRNEASDCKESESRALEVIGKMQMQLETVNKTVETLRSDGLKATEAYKSLALELEQSRSQAKSLEELVRKLDTDSTNGKGLSQENEEINGLKAALISAKSEVEQLKSALDVAEIRYQEEYIQSTLQIRSAYEQLEHRKSESSGREAELYEELRKAIAGIEELKASLMEKESQLLSLSAENEGCNSSINEKRSTERESELAAELKKMDTDVAEWKAKLLDRETELKNVTEENSILKMEIKELELNKITDEAIEVEAARAAEKEALTKLSYVMEEADKSNRRVARVTEQLDAAQAANSELEAELRRLKVQSDQWRKAAEAAASILSTTGNNGKCVGKNGALDSSFNSISSKTMNSPYLEDTDDESPKKKNKNMLKKIGVLWRKNHH